MLYILRLFIVFAKCKAALRNAGRVLGPGSLGYPKCSVKGLKDPWFTNQKNVYKQKY